MGNRQVSVLPPLLFLPLRLLPLLVLSSWRHDSASAIASLPLSVRRFRTTPRAPECSSEYHDAATAGQVRSTCLRSRRVSFDHLAQKLHSGNSIHRRSFLLAGPLPLRQ